MTELALDIKNLHKRYGDVVAVNGLSMQVPAKSIFAVVGPNGAGKTTTIEIAEGLKTADSGTVEVLGRRMPDHAEEVRKDIGVQLQSTAMLERLTVGETIRLYRSFYSAGSDVAQLLDAVSLTAKADARVTKLSGGQQQRLAIALALVNDPKLVFLDEPTASLDPQARREVWKVLDRLKNRGVTVVFTTHYMDEAEKLADHVAIIDHGALVAQDTPVRLIQQLDRSDVIEFTCEPAAEAERFTYISAVSEAAIEGGRVILYTNDVRTSLAAAVDYARECGIDMQELRVRSASLEDVFIERTGHGLRE